MATLYTCNAVETLEKQYQKIDGYTIYTLEEGVLGYGLMVLTAPGYKTAIVTEEYLNCWSSAHKIRMYSKCPEKYAAMVYEKFGDILPGYCPKGIDGMRRFLTDKLMPKN